MILEKSNCLSLYLFHSFIERRIQRHAILESENVHIVDKEFDGSLLLDHVRTVGDGNWARWFRQVHQIGRAQICVAVKQYRSKCFFKLDSTFLSHTEVLISSIFTDKTRILLDDLKIISIHA